MLLKALLAVHWPALVLGLSVSASQPVVTISNGTLLGVRNDYYNQDFFLNIPFAQPPIGNLRFEQAQPINQTWGRRNATAYGPRCHSAPLILPVYTQSSFPAEESEDCLTINIIRPAGVDNVTALPVLAWIYGGIFREGGAEDQRYNMSFLVQESVRVGSPIIGVTFNYRVNGFGFLGGSAVHTSGVANIGLNDQRLALHWIQENIGAFNGDPSKVTIQGESAGAYSVGIHFLAFDGRDDGLFRAGISESGGLTQHPTMDQQNAVYLDLLNKTNCTNTTDTLQCLRRVDALDLKRAFQGVNFFPVIDGDMIQREPYISLREGRFVKRPLLLGSNTNEGSLFTVSEGLKMNNSADFEAFFGARLQVTNQTIADLAHEYLDRLTDQEIKSSLGSVLPSPGPEYGPLFGRTSLFYGDFLFTGARRYTSEMWQKFGVPAYSYRFDSAPNGFDPTIVGACHFSEIPFVFRNFNGVGHEVNFLGANSTKDRLRRLELSNAMSHRWLSFATELTPNARWVGKGLEKSVVGTALAQCKSPGCDIKWPAYNRKSTVNLVFGLNGLYLEKDNWRSSGIRRLNQILAETSVPVRGAIARSTGDVLPI